MTENKTLDEYINGRVIDHVYLATDLQALHDYKKLLIKGSTVPLENKSPEEVRDYLERIEEFKARIKATAEKVTLRGLSWSEHEEVRIADESYRREQRKLAEKDEGFDREDWEEAFEMTFEKASEPRLVVAALVSVENPDGTIINAWEKDEEYWLAWLKNILEERHASYRRLVDAVALIIDTLEIEKAILGSIDFWGLPSLATGNGLN